MSELTVSDTLTAVEHVVVVKASRVVTYAGSAKFLNVNPGTLKTSFSRNQDYFTEGVDYFRVTHLEAKDLNAQIEVGKFYNGRKGTVVFTETGLLKLATKSKSAEAWTVVQKLIDGYILSITSKNTLSQQTQELSNKMAYSAARNADSAERNALALEAIIERGSRVLEA